MATVFTLDCLDCNAPLNIPSTAIALVEINGRAHYSYACDSCQAQITRVASRETLRLFAQGNVKPVKLTLPGPRTIDRKPVTGPPITEDDLIAFARELYAP